MDWILILIAGFPPSSLTSETIEFATKESCLAVRAQLLESPLVIRDTEKSASVWDARCIYRMEGSSDTASGEPVGEIER